MYRHSIYRISYRTLFLGMTFMTAMTLTPTAPPCSAATFRMTTKIFVGKDLNAASEHLILFDNGLVYDLPQIDSRTVTVYDPAQKQVTLLDRQTQVQTTIRTEDLVRVTAQARAAAGNNEQKERLGLLAQVKPSQRVIGYAIQYGNLEYETTTQKPGDPTIAADYAVFADLASRLNVARRFGPPPFGRMTLNERIAADQSVPLETTLTLRRGKKAEKYRSTHEVVDELTAVDRDQINQVRGMLTLYRQVDFADFPTP